MPNDSSSDVLPNIAVLTPAVVRQIGSHQLLIDPSLFVKELIDNALDARAKSIYVDVTANTIDLVQVKDDGHGISYEDRPLVCRRYHTSKIKDFNDLKGVGGKWLGFRGEALASMTTMSGTVTITTRVEGEPVAVKLTYLHNGELTSTERDSHPVGTTIKVTKLLESTKVRKDLAIKSSAKCLAKIRRLVQAYALARPTVRFRLHVLKAKHNKADFLYASHAKASVEDAVLKIFGRECASQCEWTTLEVSDFGLCAFLPMPTAFGPHLANHGAFISVDSRPVSSTRGTFKKIVSTVRERLRSANSTFANVKNPFFCLNIICPFDSYDPNIEPAKDDVVFGDEAFVVALVNRLLSSYYPDGQDAVIDEQSSTENSTAERSTQLQGLGQVLPRPHTPSSMYPEAFENTEVSDIADPVEQPCWRSSMYGIDECNIDVLHEDLSGIVEEEEDCRDASISNPWTVARMNTLIKPRKADNNDQLFSPAKSYSDTFTTPQSPVTSAVRADRIWPIEPLTPQSSPRGDAVNGRFDNELKHTLSSASRDDSMNIPRPSPLRDCNPAMSTTKKRVSCKLLRPSENPVTLARPWDDTWFGEPMRNSPKALQQQTRSPQRGKPRFPKHKTTHPQTSLVVRESEHVLKTKKSLSDNADIRGFFGQPERAPLDSGLCNHSRPQSITDLFQTYPDQERLIGGSPCRPQSADSRQHSNDTFGKMDAIFRLNQASPGSPYTSICGKEPSKGTAVLERKLAPRLRRRQTTDSGFDQSKPSSLPLSLLPHGFETHSMSLAITTTVATIVDQARKLDMTANSVEWGRGMSNTSNVIVTAISESKAADWAIKLNDILCAVFERIDGVDTIRALHRGIQHSFDVHENPQSKTTPQAICTTDQDPLTSTNEGNRSRGVERMGILLGCNEIQQTLSQAVQANDNKSLPLGAATEPAEYDEDLDFAQCVDLDGKAGWESSAVRSAEFDEELCGGIEDEMLMDL